VNTQTTLLDPGNQKGQTDGHGLALLVMSVDASVSVPLPATGTITIGRSNGSDVQLDDPLASRLHARLHLGTGLEVEDMGSSNGTRLRDGLLPPNTRLPLAAGEALTIGNTVLVVQPTRRGGGVRRIWSHRWFESRLREECTRCQQSGGRFALVRLSLEHPVGWFEVVPIIDRELPPPHPFASYGPYDYELLLLGADADQPERVVDKLTAALQAYGVTTRVGVSCYPRDGRTADAVLAGANARLRPSFGRRSQDDLPSSPNRAMQRVYDVARRAARSNLNLLIVGETGVGKEVMVQTIHRLSDRSHAPLLALNCAGLSETLIESELFGHERGAFTGAIRSKKGLFESAEGGTLFLDEVGEMPAAVQAKVLRAIANREILPVGAVKPRAIDVRIVAATNRDLEQEMQTGTFRRDLYYRLNGLTLAIPPLRERREELPGLAQTFLEQAAQDCRRSPPRLSDAAMDLLLQYQWPGNIRELKNVIERALVLCEGDLIEPTHLPGEKMNVPAATSPGSSAAALIHLSPEEQAERQRMVAALEATVWNQSRAARLLNIPRRTFVSKLERYAIPRPQKGAAASDLPEDTDETP
jgi:two-component system, NtrC family, response regulator AtoC